MHPALGLLTLALAASPAANTSSDAASAPDLAAVDAKAHYNKGRELFAAHQYPEAIAEFEAAITAKPHAFTFYNLALCYEQLDDAEDQLYYLRQYLRMLPNAEDRAVQLQTMTRLEAKLPEMSGRETLQVVTDPDQAEVWIDSEARGVTPFRAQIEVGKHELALLKPGYDPETQQIEISKSRYLTVDLKLKGTNDPTKATIAAISMAHRRHADLAPSLPPSRRGLLAPLASAPPLDGHQKARRWTWVAAGGAAAALGTGLVLGYLSSKRSDDMRSSVHDQATVTRLRDQSISYRRTGNVFLGVAGVLGAAGVTLYFVEGRF
jgi:tetratricopeptide (TPR) repeat protein